MRIRTIKPAFWANEKMAVLPDFARLLAIGLLNYADDHGYFWANPLMIRGSLFPFEEDSTKIRRSLAQLAAEGYLRLGKTVDGREVGEIVNFKKHQRVDKAQASEIAPLAIFDERSTNDPRTISDELPLYRIGRDRKGMDLAPTVPVSAEGGEPKKQRERNLVFDTLARIEGSDPFQLTKTAARTIGCALAEIRLVFPNVTPDEIERRAEAYRKLMPDAQLTAFALAKNWARCVPGAARYLGNNGPSRDEQLANPSLRIT